MGAKQSVNAGKAKVDLNVDLTHMLCEALLLPPLRNSGMSFSQIVGSGNLHDNMIILKQESGYADVNDNSFLKAKHLEGSVFMDCGSDLGSARHVPGNPALRQGKPGFGVGFGYGIHYNTDIGQIRVDYAMNAFSRKTIYFGIHSGGGGS
ncbi:hypothetical protein PR202_ga05598 [Eleusine coracana subsp. coracana]|uniref:Bacterial surface antigen (D15) domain-containing protein n=1 Tax=Eleusine coracana subsp. coracana TaxID=191504 RepID=A0AAV5BTH2_ELECO|nr:hypothetical protein PR202_ga05144 [Eleusine coracana subsp. coracana]GJM89406.1 hypothetical protein PR202_ga05598 [Eleusine coracana subsp. coracana]